MRLGILSPSTKSALVDGCSWLAASAATQLRSASAVFLASTSRRPAAAPCYPLRLFIAVCRCLSQATVSQYRCSYTGTNGIGYTHVQTGLVEVGQLWHDLLRQQGHRTLPLFPRLPLVGHGQQDG